MCILCRHATVCVCACGCVCVCERVCVCMCVCVCVCALVRLERFQNRCLRVILKIFFETHGQISNSVIRQKALNQPSVEQLIRTRRLRWFGHAYHMHTSRLPNKMLSAQPPHGKRPQGKRFLTWRELLRSDLEQLFIKETWHDLVSNHKTWKSINFDPQKAKSPWQGRLRHRKDGHAQ